MCRKLVLKKNSISIREIFVVGKNKKVHGGEISKVFDLAEMQTMSESKPVFLEETEVKFGETEVLIA